jgi:membrane protease YdiL (CAAX protease family)
MISTIDRKRIFIFVAFAYAIAIALAVVIFLNGGLFLSYPYVGTPLANTLLTATMFAPAVANIAARLITREGWSNTFLRPNFRRGWRFYLAAWLLPLVAIIVGGAIYYLLFPSKFDLSMQWAREAGLIPAPWATDPWTVVTSQVVLYSLLWAPLSMFLMFGEEFGWRAYLLPKLMPLGPRRAVLLMGAIWAVWHWPAIFLGYEYGFGYWGAPVVGPLLFVLVLMFESPFYAWVTLRSGSVWPAAIGHAVNNAAALLMVYFLRGGWDQLIGPNTVGIVGSLGYALLALLILFIPGALAPTAGPRPVEPNN